MKIPLPPTRLTDGDRVAIVGGGPAGSFFAIHLLREARKLGRKIDVVILEKHPLAGENTCGHQCRGCNFCAGLISARLNQVLDENHLTLPEEIIQSRVDYIWIHGRWKNLRLRVPDEMRMCSVFRGSLPNARTGKPGGLDGFLLGEAVKEGARVEFGEVQEIAYDASGLVQIAVRRTSGETASIAAGFVAIATGINAHHGAGPGTDGLLASIKRMNPSFVPGKTRQTLIFELDAGEEFLDRNMNREIYFIEYGSKHLALEHTALIPKGRFLTAALIGRSIDRAVLPRDSRRLIREFLTLPQIDRILPGIADAPLTCACIPRMTVSTAQFPFGDRFAIIGDAVGSRLNKDGIYSAHITASSLAQAVLQEGIDQQSLARRYGKTVKWLEADNRFGRTVFAVSRAAFTLPKVSRVMYQAFATEQKERDEQSRPLSEVLWKIAGSTADYREVVREMTGYKVLRSVLGGAAVTVRNKAVELLLGVKWGEYGRYPTLVLKERREELRGELAASLGVELGNPPGFERMYWIKIRGTHEEILEELAKFGHADAKFLRLRIIDMRQIEGEPNQVGSVIRYKVPFPPLTAELRLTKRVGSDTLLYQADERLVNRGKLIFNIAPTSDGNLRLSVYAEFDYKRGVGLASRAIWRGARFLFPEFVHDVVWNHALCTIKEEVERKNPHAR